MNVVLDTNVVISALLSPLGPPAENINRWEMNEFEVSVSIYLLNELKRTLDYPKINHYLKWSPAEVKSFLESFAKFANVVDPEFRVEILEKDPDDNRVLECAAAAGAAYIVTGDRQLLELKEYRGIVILPPAGFLALLDAEEEK